MFMASMCISSGTTVEYTAGDQEIVGLKPTWYLTFESSLSSPITFSLWYVLK